MGLFDRFKKKKIQEMPEYKWMTVDEALAYSNGNLEMPEITRQRIARERKEAREQAGMDLENMKLEYGVVTGYLSDIQVIEKLPPEEREIINSHASAINLIEQENRKFSGNEKLIDDRHYSILGYYENQAVDDCKSLQKNEDYLRLVEGDLRKLAGERASLTYRQDSAQEKRRFLRGLTVGAIVFLALTFSALLFLQKYSGESFAVPFFLTGLASLAVILYIFLGDRSARFVAADCDAKLNRLTELENGIKIKYVNTTNLIDFVMDKYKVTSARELTMLWEAYIKTREEEKRREKTAFLMDSHRGELLDELKKLQLYDPEIWLSQTLALTDRKEMVEVAHRLNERRQKLRAGIERLTDDIATGNY